MTHPFALLCRAHGLPDPEPEYQFAKEIGRKWRFDWAFPESLVAVECEGAVWVQGRHTRGKGYKADMEKYAEAAIMGWAVLRFATEDVTAAKTFDMIRRAMERSR